MPRKPWNKCTPAEKAHITRKKTYRKIRSGLLFLDCTVKGSEKCSEGEFLGKYMEILNHQLRVDKKEEVEFDIIREYGPQKLKEALKYAEQYTIHVSSHGEIDDNGNTFLDLSYGRLYSEDVIDLWNQELKRLPCGRIKERMKLGTNGNKR